MNEPAIRIEEQMISLFPDRKTQFCQGWVLKDMGTGFYVYPLYYKFSQENIPDNIRRCEAISRQSGMGCTFRIVEHTNYQLRAVLADCGYVVWKCGTVCRLCLTDLEDRQSRGNREAGSGLSLRTGADAAEYVMDKNETCVGIKRENILFLPGEMILDGVELEDLVSFAVRYGITEILADVAGCEELPERYEQAGFDRVYRYCCYQKMDKYKIMR